MSVLQKLLALETKSYKLGREQNISFSTKREKQIDKFDEQIAKLLDRISKSEKLINEWEEYYAMEWDGERNY